MKSGRNSSTLRFRFTVARKGATGHVTMKNDKAASRHSRAALQLALAHHIERQIDAGVIPDYAAAAKALGLTRARLTQVMGLLLLSPVLQERVLEGELSATEHGLRSAVKEPDWDAQRTCVEKNN